MSASPRLLAVAAGLLVTFAFASPADAARTRHHSRHHAHVSTATYRATPHKVKHHRLRAANVPTRGSVAQAPRSGLGS